MSKPPIRQDVLQPMPEVRAQIEARQKRRTQERRKARPKGTYDLPARLMAAVDEIGDRESIAKSDVVALALTHFVEAYRAGQVDLEPLKERARSLRVEWKLKLPADWAE